MVLNTLNRSYSAGTCHVIQIPSVYPSDVGLEHHALENIQPCLLSIIMVAGFAVVFGINSKVMYYDHYYHRDCCHLQPI